MFGSPGTGKGLLAPCILFALCYTGGDYQEGDMARHLAFFSDRATIEKIFRREKTVEVRFSVAKLAPYGQIKKGDEIFLKVAGGKILGRVEVDNVLFYENLTSETVGKLRREYEKEAGMPANFWVQNSKSRYVSLIFLKNPERFLAPLKSKKRDRRGWVVL